MKKYDNYNKFIKLRSEYQIFEYKNFNIDLTDNGLRIKYHFSLNNKTDFEPELFFPKSDFFQFENIDDEILSALAFNIGMVELISYWKAACPKKVIIRPFGLNEDQIQFWKKIYFLGLGEFFFLNGINTDINDFMTIEADSTDRFTDFSANNGSGVIVPVGGGKDSVVSLELLKSVSNDNLALILNPRGASIDTAKAAGYGDRILEVRRTLDKNLLKLNEEGFLNGHTPFSALLAFVSFFAAYLSGRKYIALSNESSANESTVEGTDVNHQYSKSYDFENDFRNYVEKYLCKDISYFSFLRPVSEFQIAKMFSSFKHHHMHFKSCNAGSKENKWCCKCPKCLFTFIILSPFISPDEMKKIYGTNLFEDKDLKHYFDELCGIAEIKPFECVGTVDEVNSALILAIKKHYKDELPYLLEYYKSTGAYIKYSKVDEQLLTEEFVDEHFLEKEFEKVLKEALI